MPRRSQRKKARGKSNPNPQQSNRTAQPTPPKKTQESNIRSNSETENTQQLIQTAQPATNSTVEESGNTSSLEVASLKEALPANLEHQLTSRPQRTPIGRAFQCSVNHFELQIRTASVHQYRVDFNPEIENPLMKRRIIYSEETKNCIGAQFVFDGDAQLYSTRMVDDQVFDVVCGNQTISCTIRLVKNLDIHQLSAQVYNVLCKKILRYLKLAPMGRQYFDPSKSVNIPEHNIEVWPGFFNSIGSTFNGATLCIDIAHKILRTDSVLSLMEQFKWNKARISSALDGQIVLTRYNNRTYRVDSVEWNENPLTTFEAKGNQCTFIQYYKSAYNLIIRNRNQPLLRIVDRKRKEVIFLVPELCYLTGLTDEMRNNFRIMQSLDKHTKVNPENRFQQVNEFAERVSESREVQEGLNEWQFVVSKTPMKVEGCKMPVELIAAGTKPFSAGDKAEWNNKTIIQPMSILRCLIVYPRNAAKEKDELLKQLDIYSQQFKMRIQQKVVEIQNDSPASYTNAIEQHKNACFVICLLTRKGQSYHAIKKLCCEELGIPSQCVMTRSMQKRASTISSKIMQQINCKVGGELWRVRIDEKLKGTMIVGIDVCHDTHSDKGRGKRSVVGFCASTNQHYTKYFSTVKFQGVGQEIVDELGECFDAAMDNWKKINGAFPERVIVYRDGVGEGQFLQVLEFEVPQIKKVLQMKHSEIKLTEIIVQKRIHTRIFDVSGRTICNVPPGTIVDNGCVSRDSYDFYMVSQNVRQGTATPTHYRVIHDEVKLKTGEIQQLTFKLCHLYFNWAGTIRVPAPCHYAHKIAFLIGQSVHGTPHANLENWLHFL